ncbi:hypothetical protein B0H10DRAFT_2184158 [Mycena sp. CBHHK59/15]|nr:hypothetical protein B0H10DRAFT_2184158 [Mycena sp. CBHHK59/15]
MHAVVELIPLLLHVSLILFFTGLVAFLQPVNIAVTVVTAVLLGAISVVYACLTILPIRYPDCPYQTPLSVVLWSMRQLLSVFFVCRFSRRPIYDQETGERSQGTSESTMNEVMTVHATGTALALFEFTLSKVDFHRFISVVSSRTNGLKQPDLHVVDRVIAILLSLLRPDPAEPPNVSFVDYLVQYINNGGSDVVLAAVDQPLPFGIGNTLEEIWHICVLFYSPRPPAQCSPTSSRSLSAIALTQLNLLKSWEDRRTTEYAAPGGDMLLAARLQSPILLAILSHGDSESTPVADNSDFLAQFHTVDDIFLMRRVEARLSILAEFLEGCVVASANNLPFNRRVAAALLAFVYANRMPERDEILDTIIHTDIYTFNPSENVWEEGTRVRSSVSGIPTRLEP